MPNPTLSPNPPSSREPLTLGSITDLHGIIRVILDKCWLIVSCIILAIIGAAVYGQRAQRIYEAVTTVQVEQEDAKIVKAEQVVSEDMRGLDVLNTVAQKLGNDALLQRVLEENHLLPADGSLVTNGSKTMTRDEVVAQFKRKIKTSLRRNTRLIDVTVQSADPNLAARLANSLVENYLGQDALAQQTTTLGANSFLQQEALRQKKKLEASEQALQDYRKKVGSVSLEQSQDIITPRLQDLNKSLTQSRSTLILAQGAYEDSLNMPTNLNDLLAYPQVAASPDVEQIFAQVVQHENEFVLIRQRYREKHPKYILAALSLSSLKDQLQTTVLQARARIQKGQQLIYQNALTAERGLETALNSTETNAMQLSDNAVRFNVLSREVESDKVMFDSLMSRLAETAVAAQITPERIRVIQAALVPQVPVWPKMKNVFALAFFGGLGFGLTVSFVLYSINTTFRTVDEVEHYLSLPVLGTITRLPKGDVLDNKVVAIEDSNSAGAEVFRTLRTALFTLGREKDRRTFLFTSSTPGEGKTFTSVNYAACLAQQGLRTLLVDMDLRRPMVEEYFTGRRNQLPGVTDYYLERKKFGELVLPHEKIANLYWMPSGASAPNPSALLTQADFRQLLVEALTQFDRVVVDTAPLLPVSDTLLLADKAQTVVLVVQGYKTSRKAVERCVQMLNKLGAPIGGVVLNLMPNRRFSDGYYYYYYRGYSYDAYGKKEAYKTRLNA
jgi:capsular exopolysaccharide synthesis family protein